MATNQYNFDEIIDRRNSDCLKYGVLQDRWGRTDLLPLWVADMDFRTPDFIIEALRNRLQHEVLGYTAAHPQWRPAIVQWLSEQQGWQVEPHHITFIPGIVRGIAFVLQAFTQPGDKVLVMNPVYHPFFLVTEHNGREVVRHRLSINEQTQQYDIDFEQLDKDLEDVKFFVLSNPHNPGGRVWRPEELQQIALLAEKHGTLVISDEIHADLTLAPHRHTPYASVSEIARQHSITFGSPSKAFNCPGIVSSYSIVANGAIRRKFNSYLAASELDEGNMFAQLVTVAAYTHGAEWLKQAKSYIADNIKYVSEWLAANLPQIKPIRPEASYLIYLDCHGLGLTHEEVLDLFIDKAHLALDDGRKFGSEGDQFMRLNAATPRAILTQALTQLKDAVDNK
ncbi:MAG: PatB family C-S lyase [Bacteroidales bacterium]|nr:PatB family C-S lyase [Bacteroidales bacterium]